MSLSNVPPEVLDSSLASMDSETSPEWGWIKQLLSLRALRGAGAVYDFSLHGRPMVSIQEFMSAVATLGGRVIEENVFDMTSVSADEELSFKRQTIVWENGVARFHCTKERAEFFIFSLSKALVEKAVEITNTLIADYVKSDGRVFVLVQTMKGIEFESIGIAAKVFEESNYKQEVVDGYRHVVKDLTNNDPCGRIVIFDGVPGTGKTYMVRALLHDVPDAMFLLVSADLVASLASPGIVKSIIKHRQGSTGPTVFIVEDADSVLAKRGNDNMSSVSAVLNLSDGILGNLLDLRIVATTNVSRDELDEAILRASRLCRRIEVPPLDYARAVTCLTRLGGDTTLLNDTKEYSLGELYRLARTDRDDANKEIKRTRRLGFGG